MDPFANYRKECEAFLALLDPDCDKRIKLYVGQSGSGKTSLIRCCHGTACRLACYVPIQLHFDVIGIPEILWTIGKYLNWNNMSVFMEYFSKISGIDVNIAKNKILGSANQIRVVINAENQDTRKERLMLMTEALFEDLRKMDKVLLIVIDSYEQATKEVKKWINGIFLARAIDSTDKVRVAVAGQEVPDANNIVWGDGCETFELLGVYNAKDWMPVVDAKERVIPNENPLDYLQGICDALEGRPDAIMKVIDAFKKHEKRHTFKSSIGKDRQ